MALEKAFVEGFGNNTQLNYEAFHTAVADRVTELERAQQQQQFQHQLDTERAQLQQQYQLAMQQLGSSSSSTAPATAPDGDVAM